MFSTKQNVALAIGGLAAAAIAGVIARYTVISTTSDIEEQITKKREEELRGILEGKKAAAAAQRDLIREGTKVDLVDLKARVAEAKKAMDVLLIAQKQPGAISKNAGFLANEFVNVLRMRYPLAFEKTPGLARSVETRLVAAMARNTLQAVEKLEKQLEYETSIAASRTAAGEDTFAPLGY